MRALLGLLLLGGLFLSAATWQDRMSHQLREQRARVHGVPEDAVRRAEVRAGWSELVLGRPSGRPALPALREVERELPPLADSLSEEDSARAAPPGTNDRARYSPDFEYVVRPNDTLGTICQKHYGKGRLGVIVPAVARYNDLAKPDAIGVGRVLLLPDVELLLGPNEAKR